MVWDGGQRRPEEAACQREETGCGTTGSVHGVERVAWELWGGWGGMGFLQVCLCGSLTFPFPWGRSVAGVELGSGAGSEGEEQELSQ